MKRYLISTFIGLVIAIVAGCIFIVQSRDYLKASQVYEDTITKYVIMDDGSDNPSNVFKPTYSKNNETQYFEQEDASLEGSSNEPSVLEDSVEDDAWESLIDVHIAGLQAENKDVVGWIYFENVDISYPILYSGDDATYLRKAYTGESFEAGSIFLEGQNNKDFSDSHTIIYGHNMKNRTMFGRLKYYAQDSDYINGHEYFQIITAGKKYRYKIFAYKIVPEDSDVYTLYTRGGTDFWKFVTNVLCKDNYIENSSLVKYDDHVITLSTCANDDRFVLSAVRCDECNVNW